MRTVARTHDGKRSAADIALAWATGTREADVTTGATVNATVKTSPSEALYDAEMLKANACGGGHTAKAQD